VPGVTPPVTQHDLLHLAVGGERKGVEYLDVARGGKAAMRSAQKATRVGDAVELFVEDGAPVARRAG
jgi:hypothetical protein